MVAEALGTGLLLAAVVGSGIMGERLAGGNVAVALMANTLATGAMLVVLIYSLAPISGAHLNPAVTLAAAVAGEFAWREAGEYVVAQVAGAVCGVSVAHLMFELPLFSLSEHVRAGASQMLSEAVATFGLLFVIGRCARSGGPVALVVGAYIVGAYWFTASTSFANPAVTLARALSNTFAGIRPLDAPGFIASQLVGAGSAVALSRWFDAGMASTTNGSKQ
jgi:glycerol uptake facilitator-like aquaporin